MAGFKEIKFYILLLTGIAISVLAIVTFFTSSISFSLFKIANLSYTPDVIGEISNKLKFSSFTNTKNITFKTNSSTTTIRAAVSDNQAKRTKGLMGVDKLDDNQGMLFIFDDSPKAESFWMKNTSIPLDIIYIGKNKTVTQIEKNAQPCSSEPCPIYSSTYPISYAIEVNGGWCDRNDITEGTIVSF